VRHVLADGGAVISASHNPAEYNGIKFLDQDGCKLSDDAELSVEEYLGENLLTDDWRPTGASVGEIRSLPDIARHYAVHLASQVKRKESLLSSVVADCAHGAAAKVMPFLIELLGAKWDLIGAKPDGLNINEGVGVIHIGYLSEHVTKFGYRLGFAYDGDADRMLMVDEKGRTIDGDIVVWVLARWLAAQNDLGSGAVVTVMSNMALEEHLSREGIRLFRCPVGDRYVFEAMKRHGARLGGEQSGHVMANSYSNTGDGLCTTFMMLSACLDLGEDINTLVDRFDRYPQRLRSVSIAEDRAIDMNFVDSVSAKTQSRMGGNGRIFVRKSGTEPLLRVLVEARDSSLVEEISEHLVSIFREHCS
jgi:phosphoglucosamine mutase